MGPEPKPMGMVNVGEPEEKTPKDERMPEEVFAKLTELYFKEYHIRTQESYDKLYKEIQSLRETIEELKICLLDE